MVISCFFTCPNLILSSADVLLSLDANQDGISLSKDNIKEIILDVYGGDTHTTFVTLERTMAEPILHPEVMKRVQEEVRGVLGLKRSIHQDYLSEMKYMKALIKESLRLQPALPLMLPHESLEDTQVMGHNIPSKTMVIIIAWLIWRDPD